MRSCRICNIEKSLESFWKRTHIKDGIDTMCIECRTKEHKTNPTSGYMLRLRAIEALGCKCVHCGFDDVRALQIDHINGGGSQEFIKSGNRSVYQKIADGNTDGYQVLCANCNWIKKTVESESGRYYFTRRR